MSVTANSAPASYFALQHPGVRVEVDGVDVALGEGRDADAHVVALADQRDQLVGVGQAALGRRPRRAGAAGRVAAQRHHVATPAASSSSRIAASSSVVWPTQVRCATGSSVVSRAMRSVIATVRSRVRAAGAVRHRHERRAVGLELGDRAPELLLPRLVLGREELERERPLAAREQLAHAQVPVRASCATAYGRDRAVRRHPSTG